MDKVVSKRFTRCVSWRLRRAGVFGLGRLRGPMRVSTARVSLAKATFVSAFRLVGRALVACAMFERLCLARRTILQPIFVTFQGQFEQAID